MPDLGFQDLGSGFRPTRDLSPDSFIFTGESNFSLFSSASGSVERCSFASDVPAADQPSLASEVSQHLAGRGLSSGPDPDPNKPTFIHKKNVNHIRKEKAKVYKVDSSEAETTEDENVTGGSARNSFSQALKDCQDRRLRSEILLRKAERRRPASIDLNNSTVNAPKSTSPRFGAMKKASASTTKKIGAFPSPGTPNYRHSSLGFQKGWSSERIPPNAAAYRRNLNNTMLPYNNNGRTLPSKWEDAERWIFSPVLGDGGSVKTSLQQQHRRPKSKSGPLGPPGVAYEQMFSPATPMFDGGNIGNVIATSPFSAGGMTADGLSMPYGAREAFRNILMSAEPCMTRSISIHGCSEMLRQSSLNAQPDEKYDDTENYANNVSRAFSRRDMATQMSPESSPQSSPRMQSSYSTATAVTPVADLQSASSSRPEIRDVTIDERISTTRWSKKNKTPGGGNRNVVDWKNKAMSIGTSSWPDVSSDASNSISKIQWEEAKIIAWENLQKAKAESAIRKLEMKLEKKRSSSMDKIMKKLRAAQKKAQEMKSPGLSSQINHSGRSSNKSLSFRRSPQIGSLSGCFTCHAFNAS